MAILHIGAEDGVDVEVVFGEARIVDFCIPPEGVSDGASSDSC